MNVKTISAGLAIAAFALLSAEPAHAQSFQTEDKVWVFNEGVDGWFFAGHSGYDSPGALYSNSPGDLWVNNWQPGVWNAVNVATSAGVGEWEGNTTTCYFTVNYETSPNFTGGVMDIWDVNYDGTLGARLYDQPLNTQVSPSSQFFVVDATHATTQLIVDFGFWGTGEGQWMRVYSVKQVCNNCDSSGGEC